MCGGKKFSDFQVDCLDAHNDYRSRHGVPALNLNEGLCKYAEDHAKFMSQCDSEKPSKSPYGENIFIKKSSKKIYPNAFEPVTQWYSEISQFDDQTSYPSKDIKHFVQVVWKETRSMGVGFAINQSNNTLYVVANYFPAGNDFDTFSQNVKPLRKHMKDCPPKVKVI